MRVEIASGRLTAPTQNHLRGILCVGGPASANELTAQKINKAEINVFLIHLENDPRIMAIKKRRNRQDDEIDRLTGITCCFFVATAACE